MQNTTALVLAGGINLGFSVLTHNRAKSALPFCGHFRIIDYVLTNLNYSGINNVGVLIQYLPGSLIDHIGIGRAWDFDTANRRIKLMPPFVGMGKTQWFRGTADAVYQNLNFLSDTKAEHVLIVSGDHIYSMDYGPLLAFHRYHNADITIVTAKRPPDIHADHFGYVTSDARGRVSEFLEKPATPPHDVISTGIYLVTARRLIEQLEAAHEVEATHHLPTSVVEPIVRQGRAFAFPFEGEWEYLPDLESYVRVHRRLLAGEGGALPQQRHVLTNMRDRDLGSRPSPYFGRLSHVSESLVSPGCIVEGRVERSVLSPGVRVAPRAVVRDSILLHDCEVEEGAVLEGVVSDKDAVFGAFSRVGGGPLDPTRPLTPQMTIVGKAARVMPGMRLEAGSVAPINQIVRKGWQPTRVHAAPSVAAP